MTAKKNSKGPEKKIEAPKKTQQEISKQNRINVSKALAKRRNG